MTSDKITMTFNGVDVEFPLWEVHSEVVGKQRPNIDDKPIRVEKRVQKYYTPAKAKEMIEKATGEEWEWADNVPVFELVYWITPGRVVKRDQPPYWRNVWGAEVNEEFGICKVINIFGQPTPPDNWRPE